MSASCSESPLSLCPYSSPLNWRFTTFSMLCSTWCPSTCCGKEVRPADHTPAPPLQLAAPFCFGESQPLGCLLRSIQHFQFVLVSSQLILSPPWRRKRRRRRRRRRRRFVLMLTCVVLCSILGIFLFSGILEDISLCYSQFSFSYTGGKN